MKHYQRVLLGVFALLIAALALFVLLMALGWKEPLNYLQTMLVQEQGRWLAAAVAALVFLLVMKLLFDSLRPVHNAQASIQTTALGEVNINISALENMVKKAVQPIKGLHSIKPKIKCVPEGIAVFIKVQVATEMNIPEITADMQIKIKEYLETYAGIKLLEARILVEDAPQEAKTRVE